ncbi:hypothetical protein SEA_SIRVICTOR_47 [Microbacterium phage SirVictor]|nr:hypothetical protein SEA_SIRVICTOR_47 [Microbacterium phage SirVictor]WNM74390.1 hypothetical protein SEA_GUETZIE_47 [Microbacterium phage Guetzie]
MNPWDILFAVLGWVFLALAVFGAAILVFATLVGMARGIRKWFRPGVTGKKSAPTLETYSAEAKVVATDMFKDEIVFGEEMTKAFQAGARWGWGFFHRK